MPAARSPICCPTPKRPETQSLIEDVQALSLRLGEKDAEAYLMHCARAHDALSKDRPAGRDRSLAAAADRFARGRHRRPPRPALRRRQLRLRELARHRPRQPQLGRGDRHGYRRFDRQLPRPDRRRAGRQPRPDFAPSSPRPTAMSASVSGQAKAHPEYEMLAAAMSDALAELRRLRNGAALVVAPGRGASRRRRLRRSLCPRQAQRRGCRFRRSDRLDARACSTRRGWANGCATSSTGAPTISWSTKRRTPTPTNGRSSTRWPGNISAGQGAADARWRTLFMVGDFKQAIFGFQGTDPREFEKMRRIVRGKAELLRDAEGEATKPSGSRSNSATCRSTPASARPRRSSRWSMR